MNTPKPFEKMQVFALSRPCITVAETNKADYRHTFQGNRFLMTICLMVEDGTLPTIGNKILFGGKYRWHAVAFFWDKSGDQAIPFDGWSVEMQNTADRLLMLALDGVGDPKKYWASPYETGMHIFRALTPDEDKRVPKRLIITP